MKASPGFVLKNVADEHFLMPSGANINRFGGVILLNGPALLVWEKLREPVSREELLSAILEEYAVDRETASADLDALLERLREYGAVEDT